MNQEESNVLTSLENLIRACIICVIIYHGSAIGKPVHCPCVGTRFVRILVGNTLTYHSQLQHDGRSLQLCGAHQDALCQAQAQTAVHN